MTTPNLVNIIFGMKIRQARLEANMSLSKLASRAELSPSYLTEIEKGRKYPKPDKIINIAHVLGKDYDELVSIKLGPSLTYLESILASPLLQKFPYEEFDLEVGDLLNIFTRAPDKMSALLHAILEIGRRYDLKEEHFLRAALRSYQEIHENYFQDIEDAAKKFIKKYKLKNEVPLSVALLKKIITTKFGYQLDEKLLAVHEQLSHYRSVFVAGTKPTLLLNTALQPNQLKFLLARELGYQFLGITDRANTSAPDKVDSFEQVLNDFKASYFAGALMLPRSLILADLQAFFEEETWKPNLLLAMLEKYDVTPEMLLYRFSELIPQFFGLPLHFLRFQTVGQSYYLVKHFNMNKLLLPNGVNLREHHCRRWLSVRLLKEITSRSKTDGGDDVPIVKAQISDFLDPPDRFFSFGFARPLLLNPNVGSSVVIGFRLTSDLKHTVRFVEDPAISVTIINETCERCPLLQEQCAVRAAPPNILEKEKATAERKMALKQLMATIQG